MRASSLAKRGSELAAINIHCSSAVGYALDGAAVAIAPPVGCFILPNAPNSGSIPSIMLSTLSVSATSIVSKRAVAPNFSRRHSAETMPKAA